jgi:hypothetical protein
MNSKVKVFFLGAAAGIAALKVLKTSCFRKSCARVMSAGIRLKSDATQFVEEVKEDAEDLTAEADQKKKAAKK